MRDFKTLVWNLMQQFPQARAPEDTATFMGLKDLSQRTFFLALPEFGNANYQAWLDLQQVMQGFFPTGMTNENYERFMAMPEPNWRRTVLLMLRGEHELQPIPEQTELRIARDIHINQVRINKDGSQGPVIIRLFDDGYRIHFKWVSGAPDNVDPDEEHLWAEYKQCDFPGISAAIAAHLMGVDRA